MDFTGNVLEHKAMITGAPKRDCKQSYACSFAIHSFTCPVGRSSAGDLKHILILTAALKTLTVKAQFTAATYHHILFVTYK
eukprot:1145053-Pelagomonas_calceolata.AAC.3